MRLRIPLFVKIAVPLAVLIILVMGAAIMRMYTLVSNHVLGSLDNRLRRAAQYVASQIDPAELAQITRPTDMDLPAYQNIYQLVSMSRETSNLAWIGIYRREGGHFSYVVDADATGIGYPFF